MNVGRVYVWNADASRFARGYVQLATSPLLHLDGRGGLSGEFVVVRNDGEVAVHQPGTDDITTMPIGNACSNADGDFIFVPGRGGGRIDKQRVAEADFLGRYIESSHFGEVNSYYHLDLIAHYVNGLLTELGTKPLPRVTAAVNAHGAGVDCCGTRDGVRGTNRWLPFQGGHYRLPARRYDIAEWKPLSVDGEIHLGPGWKLTEHGALVEAAGGRYRANASHNAGILYHEYGHHITRHTADFRANALRRTDRQNNRKTAMDEGTCDYFAAAMLGTPHIWCWHRRHDEQEIHPRSLASTKTMKDFDASPAADPHANGTIWAAALWDLRQAFSVIMASGNRAADLLVLKALLVVGTFGTEERATVKSVRVARRTFAAGLAGLLRADEELHGGEHREMISRVFAARGIALPDNAPDPLRMLDAELLNEQELDMRLGTDKFSLVAAGDLMLGGRARRRLQQFGEAYPFKAVKPLLQRADIVLANLEAPFAERAEKLQRTFSYRVPPKRAREIRAAGFNVVTAANNHLMDCGREGIVETIETLKTAGITAIGVGMNRELAHEPAVFETGRLRVGLLGYYWNQRCGATDALPGCAVDTQEKVGRDIRALRQNVDRVVVTAHWGVPYVRDVDGEDQIKARFAVDCGADLVIGHHPHIVQKFELYRGRPIFYSVGNFMLGSGNSRAEGMMLAVTFSKMTTAVQLYPLAVKNRDPRINYQPKIMHGEAARKLLVLLQEISGDDGHAMTIDGDRGVLIVPVERPSMELAGDFQ